MNLYLYIPPGSAHPGKMFRSLIFGRLRAYWLQITHLCDFYAMAVLLARRLIACGYSFPTLKPLLEEASVRLQTQLSQRRAIPRQLPDPNDPAKKPIIFHLTYHPRGIQQSQVCPKSTWRLWRRSSRIKIYNLASMPVTQMSNMRLAFLAQNHQMSSWSPGSYLPMPANFSNVTKVNQWFIAYS
jgi:hypothetical protein